MTASEIINAIGISELAQGVGVTGDAVRKARINNKIPARWFDFCEKALGRDLPRNCFSFI